jgi:hypothetical protein
MGSRYLGANWAAFMGDIKRLGGFNAQFGPGSTSGAQGQEIEMQDRMVEAGMQGVDVTDAVVWHYVPAECMSFGWLLKRQHKGGMRKGMGKDEPLREFVINFAKKTLVSLGVAAKGLVLLDLQKVLFVFFNSAQRLGVARGYLWSRRNERRESAD